MQNKWRGSSPSLRKSDTIDNIDSRGLIRYTIYAGTNDRRQLALNQ